MYNYTNSPSPSFEIQLKFNKLFLFLLIIIIAEPSFLLAQVDVLWSKIYGRDGIDLCRAQQTTDGGYLINGYTKDFNSNGDVWLIKTNSKGDTLWTKIYGGIDNDVAPSAFQSIDGGYVIAGNTMSFGAGDFDFWLIKTDSTGDTLWTKIYGGIGRDYIISSQQTLEGGYIFAGNRDSAGTGNHDIWLIKTNSSGDTLWTKTFGGSGSDHGWFVRQTTDGGYILLGDIDFFNICLIKTDPSGGTLWTKILGGGTAFSVQQTMDGGYIITGESYSQTTSYDALLIKTDPEGNTLWTKTFGGTANDKGYSLEQTNNGGYIIVGGLNSTWEGGDIWLIRTNASGDTLWTKTFGEAGVDWGTSIRKCTDGGYIIAGQIETPDYDYDVLLIKTSTDLTDIKQNPDFIYSNFSLQQNYPNPFNPATTFNYSVPTISQVIIKVLDILGNEIETLVNEEKPAGTYDLSWNASNLASGVYFYRLQAGEFVQTRKMILMK